MVHESFDARGAELPYEEEAAFLVASVVDRHQDKVDGFLRKLRIGVGPKTTKKSLKRLDSVLFAVSAVSGASKGLAVAGRRNFGIPQVLLNRLSSAGLLTTTVLYILAHARLRGISATDPRVQSALRTALMASVSLPVGNMVVENLSRFARPSAGMPTDPRTVAVLAVSGAAGGAAGGAFARGIIDAVGAVFGELGEPEDEDVIFPEVIEEP